MWGKPSPSATRGNGTLILRPAGPKLGGQRRELDDPKPRHKAGDHSVVPGPYGSRQGAQSINETWACFDLARGAAGNFGVPDRKFRQSGRDGHSSGISIRAVDSVTGAQRACGGLGRGNRSQTCCPRPAFRRREAWRAKDRWVIQATVGRPPAFTGYRFAGRRPTPQPFAVSGRTAKAGVLLPD